MSDYTFTVAEHRKLRWISRNSLGEATAIANTTSGRNVKFVNSQGVVIRADRISESEELLRLVPWRDVLSFEFSSADTGMRPQ